MSSLAQENRTLTQRRTREINVYDLSGKAGPYLQR